MAWHVQEQEEKIGKSCNIVKCKRVRFFPIDNGGDIGFGKLGFLCLKIIIRSDKGYELTLNLSTARGINYPTFKIKHPWNKIENKNGEVEAYDTQREFERRIKAFGGDSLVNEIMGLFASRFVELTRKQEKKMAA